MKTKVRITNVRVRAAHLFRRITCLIGTISQEIPFTFRENGKPTTLREARKNHYLPGFSGVTSVLAKPGLDKWKENQLLEAAASIGQPSGQATDQHFLKWKQDVKILANERSLKARDRGSEIHDAIEQYIKYGESDADIPCELWKYVDAVERVLFTEMGLSIRTLEAETTFSSSLGYGGMIDGLLRSQDYSSKPIEAFGLLLDWKTKDKEFDDKTKLVFDEHGMQLAAYRYGVGLPNAICANVFISPSAKIRVHIWEEEELQRLFEKFKCCLTLWQLDRKYDSGWEE